MSRFQKPNYIKMLANSSSFINQSVIKGYQDKRECSTKSTLLYCSKELLVVGERAPTFSCLSSNKLV